MKKYWHINPKQQAGYVYPLVLFFLMLWTLLIMAGLEEIRIQREQIQLDKEFYELHTLYQMTKERLRKEEKTESIQYHFPNGTALVESIIRDEEHIYYKVILTTFTNGQAERFDLLFKRKRL